MNMGAVRFLIAGLCILLGFSAWADSGESVVVVYNSRMPLSKKVAEHYAEKRQVPSEQ